MGALKRTLPLIRRTGYGLLTAYTAACGGAAPVAPPPPPPPPPPAPTIDLLVGYIQRLPLIPWVWDSPHPDVEGWPAPGQQVTWHAHVRNVGTGAAVGASYLWLLDGVEVARGRVDVPAHGEATVDLPWTWTFQRHALTLVLDPDHAITEVEARNNQLQIDTDAITIGFWVAQSMYDYFDEHQHELPIGSNSFEDWVQRQIAIYNQMLANAKTPEAPQGVLDRLRVDRITVLPDASVPFLAVADTNDRTVDLQWAIPVGFNIGASGLFNRFTDHIHADPTNPFYYDGVMFHELGHARYLVDVYAYDVWDKARNQTIDITEGHIRVAGSPFMPIEPAGRVFENPMDGLMNNSYLKIDRVSAAALNLIYHHRAIQGNYNAPGNLGAFLLDLPAHNRLTLLDAGGHTLPGANVRLYSHTTGVNIYARYYDDVPDLELTADAGGTVDLPQDPFPVVETLTDPNGVSETQSRMAVLIVRVEYQGKVGYGFLPAYQFNLQYWAGHHELGQYDLAVTLR